MELKKSWDFRKFMVGVFFTMLTLYLLIGLTPAKATEVDVATAANVGCDCIVVTWGYRSVEVLEAAGADILIDTPSQLYNV